MRIYLVRSVLMVFSILVLASCEKEEKPLPLPPKGESKIERLTMGEKYENQIFYSFTNGIVHTSIIKSWDLAFETSDNGFHIFMNGGNDMEVYNTHSTNITEVVTPPGKKEKVWLADDPNGLPENTAIGDWVGKNEVYIIRFNPSVYPDTFKKIQFVRSSDGYILLAGSLRNEETVTVNIKKDKTCNYSYFSFAENAQVSGIEPGKDTWDIVFTRYKYLYKNMESETVINGFPYPVNGVLLNPNNTTAVLDSLPDYADVNGSHIASSINYTNVRDMIGWQWKTYDIDKSLYTVNQKKAYLIKTNKGEFWKMHFLDFYSPSGQKGYPSFEYEQLQ